MPEPPTVFVVDADAETRQAIRLLLEAAELRVETFRLAKDFLAAYRPDRPGCIVLDAFLPGTQELELQEQLARLEPPPQVIVVTAYGDIPMAVRAMRNGAVDFLEKPFRPQLLLSRIYEALERDAQLRQRYDRFQEIQTRAYRLTRRERQVFDLVVTGLTNKAIGARLGVSTKSVEGCRARMVQKMRAANLPDLVRMHVILTGELFVPIEAEAQAYAHIPVSQLGNPPGAATPGPLHPYGWLAKLPGQRWPALPLPSPHGAPPAHARGPHDPTRRRRAPEQH